jgi:hypothetical protein
MRIAGGGAMTKGIAAIGSSCSAKRRSSKRLGGLPLSECDGSVSFQLTSASIGQSDIL